ncbi:MAG: type VI secretion system contractile sheath large subunit [Gemmataceae bacterium]
MSNFLDEILSRPLAERPEPDTLLERFLRAPPLEALLLWLGPAEGWRGPELKRRVALNLSHALAAIDAAMSRQVNAVLHHPAFQRLESSWRGLHYLVQQAPEGTNIKVRVLSATWKELARDLERAIEFDQSQLFRKVYNEEFGMPGGEPYGVLLGDYEIRHQPGPDHPTDDLAALGKAAEVAAAAFAPFVIGAEPEVFQLASFAEMEVPRNLPRVFEQTEYVKWRALRDTDDARFVGVTLPRVLARLPYGDVTSRNDGFRFREDVSAPDRRGYLWGTAVYAFGSTLLRAFAESGWLASIRGLRRDVEGGGLVTGLPAHPFRANPSAVAPKCSTDVIITDSREKELGELGFIALCHCPDTELSAFYGNQSVQRPRGYDDPVATMNARLSAMLQYILCVSRFAHYLKVMARDKIGSFKTPEEIENRLNEWLRKYTTANDNAGPELKAKFPLREGKVQVREHPGKPGSYMSVVHLRPHFQLDQMVASVKLVTELNPMRQV